MEGYSGDSATAIAPAGDIFYRTGDVARRDTEGYLWYVGRADDVFKSSDYRISPFKLESVAIEHPAVGEAAVVPSPDPLRLAVPKCFVGLKAGLCSDARARCRHLRAPAPAAGPVRAHSASRVRRHTKDPLGKDPASAASAARSETTCIQTRKASSNSSRTRRRARNSTGRSSTCPWTPFTSGTRNSG